MLYPLEHLAFENRTVLAKPDVAGSILDRFVAVDFASSYPDHTDLT